LLDSGRIIYLRVSPEAAVRRMGRGIVRRPLLITAANPYEAMRVLHETREPLYEGYSEIRIETSGMARSAVIATVVESVLAAERDIANTTTNEND
jgi:shikimate kinase